MKIMKPLLVLAALVATALPAFAQEEKKEDTTAKVDEIISKMIEASGGANAYRSIKNRVATGKMIIPAQDMEASFKRVEAAPASTYLRIEIEQMGMTQEQGSDGKVAWAKDSIGGTRLLEGAELADNLAESKFNSILEWKQMFPKRSYEGEADFGSKKCHKLLMVLASGTEQTWYVDSETHLQMGIETTEPLAMGKVKVTVVMKDYKKVDGVMLPHRMEMTQMGQEFAIELENIKQNVELDENAFAFPDDVKKLIERKKAKEAEKKKAEEAGTKD